VSIVRPKRVVQQGEGENSTEIGGRFSGDIEAVEREIDPSVADEQPRAGVREGDLVERFGRAGLEGVTGGTLETSVDYADFDDYWEPFTGAAGPATGAFYASLDDAGKATLRDTVRASLPEGPFTLPARAWLALGTVPG
jgi:hypothetical protein